MLLGMPTPRDLARGAVNVLLAFLLVCSRFAFGQSQTPIFQVDTTLQSIAVQVADREGNYLHGLSASDFTLLEDGRPQKIVFFASEREPISLAVLLDLSRTMDFGGKMDRALALLAPIIHRTHAEDEIFLMPFTDELGAFQQITDEQRSQPPIFGPLGHRGSALYDALAAALCHMRTAKNVRRAVVVITDGMDQDSRLKLEQAIGLVRSSNPQVFMIGLFDSPSSRIYSLGRKTVTLTGLREVDNPVLVFRRFASESGAESFFPSSAGDLRKALDRISAILAAEYTLAYYPARTDRLRKIEVKVNRRGSRILARRTVGTESGFEAVHFTTTSCAVSPAEHPHPWEARMTSSPASPRSYHEDFSDARSGWPNGHSPNANAHYIRGGYELSRSVLPVNDTFSTADGEVADPGDSVIAAYGPWWTDFRASALLEGRPEHWAKSLRETGLPDRTDSGVGLVFNLTERGYHAFLLMADESVNGTTVELIKADWNGARAVLMPPTRIAVTQQDQRAVHKLSVESVRGQLTLSVDEHVVGKIHDADFGIGLVGFGVFGRGRLTVRDLLVQALR